jgi:hypothetical protein
MENLYLYIYHTSCESGTWNTSTRFTDMNGTFVVDYGGRWPHTGKGNYPKGNKSFIYMSLL